MQLLLRDVGTLDQLRDDVVIGHVRFGHVRWGGCALEARDGEPADLAASMVGIALIRGLNRRLI